MVHPYRHVLKATLAGIILALIISAASQLLFPEEALRRATLYTGRASALLFLPVFAARPLTHLFKAPIFKTLMRQRAAFGLILAGNHHVHMVLLTIYLVGEGMGPLVFFLNPGLYIYGLLILMNLTSFPKARKWVSTKTIDRLHWIGLYALSAAFLQTISLNVITGDKEGYFYWVFTAAILAAFGLRIAAKLGSLKLKPTFDE